MLFFICVFCTILFLITAGASKAFGKGIGTIVGLGFPLLFIGGIFMAIMVVALPFLMAVIIPLALFGGGSYLVLRLLNLVKKDSKVLPRP